MPVKNNWLSLVLVFVKIVSLKRLSEHVLMETVISTRL